MAHDRKYGQISIPGIPDDEPVFVLRAKDELAVYAIDGYLDDAVDNDRPEAFCDGVTQVIKDFRDWRDAHPDVVKLPD